MAVVVKRTKGNRYKVHRILTTQGETIVMPEMANAGMNTVGAITNNSQSLGGSTPAITTALTDTVADNGADVNQKFSLTAAEQKRETIQNLRKYMAGDMSTAEIRDYLGGNVMGGGVQFQSYGQTEKILREAQGWVQNEGIGF